MDRLQLVQIVSLVAGLNAAFIGVFGVVPAGLAVAGACFVLSGTLTIAGVRLALAGPLGTVLRHALGGARIAYARVRGAIWIVLGLMLVLFALQRMALGPGDPSAPTPPGPLAAHVLPAPRTSPA